MKLIMAGVILVAAALLCCYLIEIDDSYVWRR